MVAQNDALGRIDEIESERKALSGEVHELRRSGRACPA